MQDTDPTPSTSQAARLVAWLRLEQTPGVGPVTAQRLLARFDSPCTVFSVGHAALAAVVPDAIARALATPPTPDAADAIEAALAWGRTPAHHLLAIDDPAYPALLKRLPDPPILLYAIGRIELLAGPSVAIVGSRNATLQGKATATAFGAALSQAGLTVVSGMALGIDAAAHEGGLRGPGSTIAVIGTGADRIYPRRNAELARRIAVDGCILSEYRLGTAPLSENFPKRNRLISGLSAAVLVVEAADGSGSLITAEVANDQGRDVFAIPGSIHSPLSRGCHQLIKQGATLVDCADDLLRSLALAPLVAGCTPAEPAAAAPPEPDGHAAERALLGSLGHGPLHPDALVAATGMAPGPLAAQLLSLELAGLVERLPGGFFQRLNR